MSRKTLQYIGIIVVGAGSFFAAWHGRGTAQQLAGGPKWVRGYGLVDSPKVKATPGTTRILKAVVP